MIFFQFRKNLAHDGLAEENTFGVYLEAGAVLVHRRHLAVVEIQHLAVLAKERLLLFFEVSGVYARDFRFSGHQLQR